MIMSPLWCAIIVLATLVFVLLVLLAWCLWRLRRLRRLYKEEHQFDHYLVPIPEERERYEPSEGNMHMILHG